MISRHSLKLFCFATLTSMTVCAAANESCTITCYEKTPSCYVTQNKPDCLDITNEAPSCTKGKVTCSSEGSKTKTVYNFDKVISKTVVKGNESSN